MHIRSICAWLMLTTALVSVNAQYSRLSGTIVNQALVPVSGLVVVLGRAQLTDTTDEKGQFSFTSLATSAPGLSPAPFSEASIRGTNLIVPSISPFQPVAVELYDAHGKLLGVQHDRGVGGSGISLKGLLSLSTSVFLVVIRHGSTVNRFQVMKAGNRLMLAQNQQTAPTKSGLSRSAVAAAAVDSLVVFRRGAREHSSPITSYTGTLSLKLDLIPYEVVEIAVSQEGRGMPEVGKELTSEPYNLGRYVPAGAAWCSEFASWAYKAGGYPLSGGRRYDWFIESNTALKSWFAKYTRFVSRTDQFWNSATPRPGDYIRYDNSSGGHAGIVRSVDGTTLYTVEGNVNNKVMLRTIRSWRSQTSIDGIGMRSGATPLL